MVLTFLIAALWAAQGFAQSQDPKMPSREVKTKLLSTEVTKFDKPFRLGVGKRAITYQEALVLKVQVDRKEFDSLPPSIEPFLYVGRSEYRIFHIDRRASRDQLTLTFHVRNWEKLEDKAPMVLTIEHGAPARDAKRFAGPEFPRFDKRKIVDKR